MKILFLAALVLAPSLVHADELAKPSPRKAKKFYVRAGIAQIAPQEQSEEMTLANIEGPASLSLQDGPIAGSGAAISTATIPAAIVGYTLPWGDGKFSLETVLGIPFRMRFEATGTLANQSIAPTALGIPTEVGPMGPEIGEAKVIPVVLTAIYRLPGFWEFTPHIGAGPTIMFAVEEKVTNMMLTEVSQPEMSIAPSPGLVLQAGLDARLTNRIYARFDVKFIALLRANATVKNIEVRTPGLPLFDTVEVGTAKMGMWVNPLIFIAGLGTDF